MPNSPAEILSGQFKDSVDTAAEALKVAANGTRGFSEEASNVLTAATTQIGRVGQSLRTHGVSTAKNAARYAKHEVGANPLASLAAALTAVVAVLGMVAVNRRSKDAAR